MESLIEENSLVVSTTDNNTVYVQANRPVTIELELAKEIIEAGRAVSSRAGLLAIIINMRKVVFITEDARNYFVSVGAGMKGLKQMAYVSSDHLSNVITSLMIDHSDTELLPMKKTTSVEEALNWIKLCNSEQHIAIAS